MKRQHVMVLVKVLIAALLLGWLVRSGTLDFGSLGIFFDHPMLLVANLVVFAGTYLIAAFRWRLILGIAGIRLSFWRAVQLTLTGAFFNVAAPGNIGGDVVRAVYVARDLEPALRTNVVVVAFLDRLLAVGGLVAVSVMLNVGVLFSEESRLGEPTIAISVLALLTLVFPVLGLVLVRRFGKRLEKPTQGASRFGKLRIRLVAAARLVSESPGRLALGLGLSIVVHVCAIVWFAAVASAVLDRDISVAQMAVVYPLGMLSVLLPISYAGFGVGHLAFEKLFAMIGLAGGANVLNVYLIGQIVPCLFGVIPYLLLKREGAPSEAEVRETNR